MTEERREYLNKVLAKLEETESALLMGLCAEESEVESQLDITHSDILTEIINISRLIIEVKQMLGGENE